MAKATSQKNKKPTKALVVKETKALREYKAMVKQLKHDIKKLEGKEIDASVEHIVLLNYQRGIERIKKAKVKNGGQKVFNGMSQVGVIHKLKGVWELNGSDAEACLNAGISHDALRNYLLRVPELREMRALWKATMRLQARRMVHYGLTAEYKSPEFALNYLKHVEGKAGVDGTEDEAFMLSEEDMIEKRRAFATLLHPDDYGKKD
ncbi:MAG: hypothetical protein KAT71_08125 [Gammaproteobacteria bacterium]|nr:hypothetical protein [Gammaproteobacteria bacterium]